MTAMIRSKLLYMKILICIFLFSLSACSSTESDESHKFSRLSPAAGGPLLPLPDQVPVYDPDDGMFMDTLVTWLQDQGAPAHSQYEFTRADLDDDGRREGLVLLQSPHQEWCMEYGCTMYIFRAHDKGFSYLSEISPIRGPLTITEGMTNGWRDIITTVSGRSIADAKNVALKFDGQTYPAQPENQPTVIMTAADTDGIKIFP